MSWGQRAHISCQSVGWCYGLRHAVVSPGHARGEDNLDCSSGICPLIEEDFSSLGPVCDAKTRHTVANVEWFCGLQAWRACVTQAGSRETVALAAWVCKGCSSPQRSAKLEASSMCLMVQVWGWAVLHLRNTDDLLLCCSGEIKFFPGGNLVSNRSSF